MISTKELLGLNKKDEREFNDLSNRIFRSFLLYKPSTLQTIEKKDQLLKDFISFLSDYIESDFIKSYQEKTFFLNQIDKLTLKKELLEAERKQLKKSDIKEAALRLGKKVSRHLKRNNREINDQAPIRLPQ